MARGGDDGFALVEAVVAFAILAVALGVAMATVSQSARVLARAGDMDVASRVLDMLAASEIPAIDEEGTLTGRTDEDAAWRIAAESVRDGHARPLFALTVTVWPRGETGPGYIYYGFASGTER